MTAAFADDEYEVPPHGTPPAEAVERAEAGEVVYLTREGQRVAVVESAELRRQNLEQRAAYVRRREEETTERFRALWEKLADAPQETRDVVRPFIDGVLAAAEDEADLAAAEAAMADPAPSIPHEQVLRDLIAVDVRLSCGRGSTG